VVPFHCVDEQLFVQMCMVPQNAESGLHRPGFQFPHMLNL
jgi:hypothetical protein